MAQNVSYQKSVTIQDGDPESTPQYNLDNTLDPEDWSQVRALGHRMVDDVMDLLQDIRSKDVWKTIPHEAAATYKNTLPQEPTDINEIYEEFKATVLPYAKGNIHPRYFAWVEGTGTPIGVLADLLAAAMNSNVTIGEHSAMHIDGQVVNWCKQMMNYPPSSTGILLSGASMANITALNVARNSQLKKNVRTDGVYAVDGRMLLYCSAETHSCVQKAAESIGIGSSGVRKISVNSDFTINIGELIKTIEEDLANGHAPFCIVGNAGTVNTGAIDPLDELVAVCRKYDLWLHVDGAFGAIAKMLPEYAAQLKAIEVADSVAFDLHKWMYVPYEVACVLIRDAKKHRDSFAVTPSYLINEQRGLAGGPDPINNYGLELSRGFKALKVWMSLKEHGIKRYTEVINKNVLQARYLGQVINSTKELELITPVTLNIVCLRYNPGNLAIEKLNLLNKEILIRLQEQGIAAPSSTILHGQFAIRVCIVNQRTKKEDLDYFINGMLRIGSECSADSL